jgi:hypothetical protein
MRSLIAIVLLLPGCWLVFDDHGNGGDDVCLDQAGGAEIAPAPLRNPENLTCESFGGGCDPSCGPCPAVDLAPIPSWPSCGSPCETLGETACSTDPQCRVVKNAQCAVSQNCVTDFLGCFPIDTQSDPGADCFARDGWTCSRSAACTAFHRLELCPVEGGAPFECPRSFAMCMPEGRSPGHCFDAAICARLPPSCPANTMPGVASGCYTDACIPTDLCEPQPDV